MARTVAKIVRGFNNPSEWRPKFRAYARNLGDSGAQVKRRTHKTRTWSEATETSAMLVVCMIIVEVIDWLLPFPLDVFGILPRTAWGLMGIVFSPLLHLNFTHLTANVFSLFVLLILLFGDRYYLPERTLAWIWFGSGAGTWLIGRPDAIHIGASGLVYGLVAYLIAAGFWLKSWRSILVAMVVLLLYGGLFFGVLPQQGMVSWEGHLAGAITGVLVARGNHKRA
jgi:membrane associated rhomboid family serine protease